MSARKGFLIAVLLLVALNVAGIWLPGWTYLPGNLSVLVGLLVVARLAGATEADLGVRSDRILSGLRIGLAISIALAAGIAAAALVPATRGLFEDDRAAGIGIAGLLYQIAIRIPVGTALFEEFAFRGVLLGLGRAGWGGTAGTWMSALLFGLWHIAPAAMLTETNTTATGVALPIVITLAVASTTAAGFALTWIRDRTDGLAAPVVVHAVVNTASFTAAWLLF